MKRTVKQHGEITSRHYAEMFDLMLAEALSVGHTLSDLNPFGMHRIPQLAMVSLIRRAEQMEVALRMAIVPASALFGHTETIESMQAQINAWRGLETVAGIDPREAEAIAEIERELAEEYPWYADDERLNKVWGEYGSVATRRKLVG